MSRIWATSCRIPVERAKQPLLPLESVGSDDLHALRALGGVRPRFNAGLRGTTFPATDSSCLPCSILEMKERATEFNALTSLQRWDSSLIWKSVMTISIEGSYRSFLFFEDCSLSCKPNPPNSRCIQISFD